MQLSGPGPFGKLLVHRPDQNDHGDAEGEADQGLAVLAFVTKDLGRTDCTPQDRGGKEGVHSWTGQLVLRLRGADIVDAAHLEIEHANADNGAEESGHHLRAKRMARWNLDVVGQLQVVAEPDGMGTGDVAE